MFNLIALSGRKGSGKSMVASLLQKKLKGYTQQAFAAPLKATVRDLTGCNIYDLENQEFKQKDSPISKPDGGFYTYREILQLVGTDLMRKGLNDNIWIDALFSGYSPDRKWIITDCRFPNECVAVGERGGIVIRINRPGLDESDPHPSETALDTCPFKYFINNDCTLEELETKIDAVVALLSINAPCFAV